MNSAKYTNGTTSQQILSTSGKVYGIIVNSHTSGTFKLWDALTATGNVVVNTYTLPAAGSQIIMFPAPIELYTGLFITVGGTMDYTIIARAN
jgi:hypothetical protein